MMLVALAVYPWLIEGFWTSVCSWLTPLLFPCWCGGCGAWLLGACWTCLLQVFSNLGADSVGCSNHLGRLCFTDCVCVCVRDSEPLDAETSGKLWKEQNTMQSTVEIRLLFRLFMLFADCMPRRMVDKWGTPDPLDGCWYPNRRLCLSALTLTKFTYQQGMSGKLAHSHIEE